MGRKAYPPKLLKAKKLKRIATWKKSHTKSCNLTLNAELDKDILEHLAKQPNKQAYLKALIRKDIGSK